MSGGFNTHDYDKLLKPCPFCGGKAKLRSPKNLRTSRSAICSDVSCTKCGICVTSWPWSREYGCPELSRDIQDKEVIKSWNERKR
jgi:Lar family restriction alleviation protein